MPPRIRVKGLPENSIGMPRVEIKLFGDWAKTIRILQRIGPDVKEASIAAQMKVAQEVVKKVKAHIRNQDLGWAPLSAETSALKNAYGLDSRILYAHGTYYNAIQVWRKGNQHMVFAGVKKGTYGYTYSGKRSKVDVGQIGVMHEFSRGKRLPRRPLWNPTIKEMGGAAGLKTLYMGSLLYHLRMKGIPVTPFRKIF